MGEFKLTKKDWETHPHLDHRHRCLCRIVKLTIENEQVPPEDLCLVQLLETILRQSGYSGPEVDVATHAETRFRLEDEGIVPSLWPTQEEIEDEDEDE